MSTVEQRRIESELERKLTVPHEAWPWSLQISEELPPSFVGKLQAQYKADWQIIYYYYDNKRHGRIDCYCMSKIPAYALGKWDHER